MASGLGHGGEDKVKDRDWGTFQLCAFQGIMSIREERIKIGLCFSPTMFYLKARLSRCNTAGGKGFI